MGNFSGGKKRTSVSGYMPFSFRLSVTRSIKASSVNISISLMYIDMKVRMRESSDAKFAFASSSGSISSSTFESTAFVI